MSCRPAALVKKSDPTKKEIPTAVGLARAATYGNAPSANPADPIAKSRPIHQSSRRRSTAGGYAWLKPARAVGSGARSGAWAAKRSSTSRMSARKRFERSMLMPWRTTMRQMPRSVRLAGIV